MRKLTAILALLSLFALSACSSIDSGFITKKSYTAPYDSSTMECMTRNSAGICTMKVPQKTHHAATYKFDLKKNDKTGWAYVNEGDYNKFQVGDCWSC